MGWTSCRRLEVRVEFSDTNNIHENDLMEHRKNLGADDEQAYVAGPSVAWHRSKNIRSSEMRWVYKCEYSQALDQKEDR